MTRGIDAMTRDRIVTIARREPELTISAIAVRFALSRGTVHAILKTVGLAGARRKARSR